MHTVNGVGDGCRKWQQHATNAIAMQALRGVERSTVAAVPEWFQIAGIRFETALCALSLQDSPQDSSDQMVLWV